MYAERLRARSPVQLDDDLRSLDPAGSGSRGSPGNPAAQQRDAVKNPTVRTSPSGRPWNGAAGGEEGRRD